MMYEMIVIWDNCDTDIYEYETEGEAIRASEGMKVALGNQLRWTGVRPKIEKTVSKYVIMRQTQDGYETVYNPNGKKDGYTFVFEAFTKERALKLFFDSELIPKSKQGNYIAVKADEKPAEDFD